MSRRTSRSTSFTSGVNPVGTFRAKVVSVSDGLASIQIPRLGMNNVYEEVPYSGFVPTVGASVWAFFIEGNASRPMIIVGAGDSQADIHEIIAGLGLSGGGSSGSVTVDFEPSELSTTTLAYEDKVVISDDSDSGEPKLVPISEVITTANGDGGEPIGHEDKSESVISFDYSTRTFTIAPVGDSYVVWCAGQKFVKTASESVVIGSSSDLYYISFDADGVLQFTTTYFQWDSETPTAYIHYNSGEPAKYMLFDERHGIVLDWQTHEYLHRTRGAAIANGFDASNFDVSTKDGSTDDQAYIDIANGTFFDEDLQVDIVHSNTPTANTWEQDLQGPAQIPVFYQSGTTGWTYDAPTNFPLKYGGTPRPTYNLNSGGTWSTPEITSNNYGISWIVATNQLNYPVIAIMGQNYYTNVGDAEAVSWDSMNLDNLPVVELRVLYKVIYRQSGSNTPGAYFVEVDDYRRALSSATSTAAAVVDHGNLTGLGDDDHTQYLLSDGSRAAVELTVTGDLTVDTDTLFVDASTDRVGIGTSSPSYTLDVSGDGRFTSNLSVSGTTTSTGHFTAGVGIDANTGGADGGLAIRNWTNNAIYQSLATVNMSGSEYILLSDGTNTFIGSGTGATTHIRGPANSSTPELTVSSSVITSSGDHDVNGVLNVSGDIRYNNNAIIASYASATNIDHIWHDEGSNAWNFCSDTTYKAAGNSNIVAGSFSGNGSGLTSVNAATLSGIALKSSSGIPSGSQVIRSHTNGYTYLGWINTPSGATTSTIDRIYASNDNFVRYVTPATFRSQVIDGNYISTATTQTSDVFIRNAGPTVYHRDTDNRSAMTHVNSNTYYILRGNGNDSTTWATVNGYWPAYWNLENNDVVLGGQVYVPTMGGTGSFNTVRYGTGGLLYKFTSLAEQKTNITEINPLLDYLGEKSLLYDLRPIIFQEAEDRVDYNGEPLKTSRGEYTPGFIAEEVHEVAPELTYFDEDGDLISYGPEALIPHLVAELQRLAPMIESLYQAAHPEYVPPTPRDSSRGDTEKAVFDTAAAYKKANPTVTPMPPNVSVEDDDEETE